VFGAALNVVTLEHLRDPQLALCEIARVLRTGAELLLVAPHEWEVHQSPHDYFRYTRHGLELLLRRAGFGAIQIAPVGGYFRLLARRLLNGLQFFTGGARWILFLPAAALLVPPALLLPLLDGMDREKNFTLGYICTARKL
jgi:SAM-dependent methyltransferase